MYVTYGHGMKPFSTNSDYMSEDETAEYIRKKVRWLRERSRHGSGPPFYQIGRTRLYRRAEIDRWLETLRAAHVEV